MSSLSKIKEADESVLSESSHKPLGRTEVAKGYAWNASFSLIAKLIFPILQIFFYRKLGPEQIGIYAVLIPIYMICESLRDAGLALTYVADRDGDAREGQYATLAMLNATAFAAIIFFARSPLASVFRMPELVWGLEMVSVAVLLTGLSTIPANKLQKRARFRDAGLVDLVSTTLSFLAALYLVLHGFGYKALIWQFVLRSVFYTAGCWMVEPVRMVWIRIDVIRSVWKHAGHNLVNNVFFTVYTVADNLTVSRLFGVVAVGNYNAAYTFGMKPVDFFISPLAKTLLIAYTRKSHDKEALANVFARTIAISILVMVPLYAIVGCFATPLSQWILSKKYHSAGPLLEILVLYCACRSVGLLCGNVLVAMNKPVYNVYGWILAYITVGVFVLFRIHNLTLPVFVEGLAFGSVAVYGFTAAAAFVQLPARGENASKLRRAAGLATVSAGLAIGLANVGLTAPFAFALSVVLVPCVLLVGAGLVYADSALTCFTMRGLKRVYSSL